MSRYHPSLNVAITDDDDLDRMILQRAVGKTFEDCTFFEAANPDDARLVFTNSEIDLAFIDINLGPHNGFDLGRSISALNLAKTPKIIFLSGHVRQEDTETASRLTPYPVMKKPMTGPESEVFAKSIADIIAAPETAMPPTI